MRVFGFDAMNLIGALAVLAGGVALIVGGASYPVGTVGRMGPGFFPIVVGVFLVLVGTGLVLESRTVETTNQPIRLVPVAAVFAAILWWGLTIERLGLVPSTVGLVVLASLAQRRPSVKMIVWTAVFLAAFGVGVFIWGLSIPVAAIRF